MKGSRHANVLAYMHNETRLPIRGSKAGLYLKFSYILIDDLTSGRVLSKTRAG